MPWWLFALHRVSTDAKGTLARSVDPPSSMRRSLPSDCAPAAIAIRFSSEMPSLSSAMQSDGQAHRERVSSPKRRRLALNLKRRHDRPEASPHVKDLGAQEPAGQKGSLAGRRPRARDAPRVLTTELQRRAGRLRGQGEPAA